MPNIFINEMLQLSQITDDTCLMFGNVNVTVDEKVERMMMTGLHTVVDISCVSCGSIVGWKYESEHEKSQKYMEGKFILQRTSSRYSILMEAATKGFMKVTSWK